MQSSFMRDPIQGSIIPIADIANFMQTFSGRDLVRAISLYLSGIGHCLFEREVQGAYPSQSMRLKKDIFLQYVQNKLGDRQGDFFLSDEEEDSLRSTYGLFLSEFRGSVFNNINGFLFDGISDSALSLVFSRVREFYEEYDLWTKSQQ